MAPSVTYTVPHNAAQSVAQIVAQGIVPQNVASNLAPDVCIFSLTSTSDSLAKLANLVRNSHAVLNGRVVEAAVQQSVSIAGRGSVHCLNCGGAVGS